MKIFIAIIVILSVSTIGLPLWIYIIEKIFIKRKFQKLEINSKWVRDITNPFENDTVRIISKQMGTDGKTPWVMYEYQFGATNTMQFKDFLNLYTQLKNCRNCDTMKVTQNCNEDELMKERILKLVSISGNGNDFEEIKNWLEEI